MKKSLLILLLVIALNAHAQLEKDAYEMYSIKELQTTQSLVNIIRAENVIATCEAESKRRGFGGFRGALFEACSFHNNKTCTIVTGWKTNNDILGHELRHCLQGSFH